MHITLLTRSGDWYIRFVTVSRLFGTSFFCFLPFVASYDAFELLNSRSFGQNHFFLISLTGVFDIVISKLPFIQSVCLNTSLFILINMFMLYRYLNSLRCYNILTRQRVSNKRPTGLNGHLIIRDVILTSCQRAHICISTAPS